MPDRPELVGQKAPAMKLADHTGGQVKLADLRGQWVVLYFYPKADTPGCTVQACEFTDSIKDFQKLDATVIGISPDAPEDLAKFIDKHSLKVMLLSDPDHKVMDQYGAWGEKNMYGKITEGVIRSTVIIDPQGKVAHHWKKVQAAGHAAKVAEKIRDLKQQA